MTTRLPLYIDSNGDFCSFLTGDTIAPAYLGTGSPSSSNYLRGDGTWATVTGGSGSVTTVSTTAPASPSVGDAWENLNDGIKYTCITTSPTVWAEMGPGASGEQGAAAEPTPNEIATNCVFTDTGTSGAMVVTAPGVTVADGLEITVIPNNTNYSAVTLALNGGSALPVTAGGNALIHQEIMYKLPIKLTYSASDTGWYISQSSGACWACGDAVYDHQATTLGQLQAPAGANQTLTQITMNSYSDSSTPSPPSAGTITFFGRTVAGRILPAYIGPSGRNSAIQPFLGRNKVGYWDPPGNATTVPGVFGITAPTTTGTATSRSVATTNLATRMRRLGYVSSTTAGTLCYQYINNLQFSCGSGSNDGSGFTMIARFVPSNAATVSGERFFCGMTTSTSAPTNVEPSSLTNCIGVAQLSTDSTQLYLVYGGSTAQTAIALTTSFPGDTHSTTAYELAIFAPNGTANTYYVQVTNISTGAIYTNTLTGASSVIPQSTSLMNFRIWKTNNATAAAVAYDLCSIYFETDN